MPLSSAFGKSNTKQKGDSMGKLIRALLGFFGMSDDGLITRALAVVKGLTGNKDLSKPPYTMEEFQACIDAFVQSIPAALDGSKTAIAAKNNNRKEVEKMLKLLAAYVEAASGGNLAIFLSSGLEAASIVRTAAQPVSPVSVKKLGQGETGQLLGFVNGSKGATHYEWRCAALDASGVAGPWTIQIIGTARSPIAFNNLTPGTNYMLQVRALGKLGHGPWSPAATRIAI
jgi:hypothetical protein